MTTEEHPAEGHHGGEDEAAIRRIVAAFADAWNRHDPPAMASHFADDLDHVSVRGRWQRGRAELEQTYIQFHATIWKDVTYHPVVEKVHFLRPDVAIVIVRGTFRSAGASDGPADTARATWIMSREEGRWLCRAFQQTYVQDIPIAPR